MRDEHKRQRKILRPGYSFEFRGKGVKSINRKIVRNKIKANDMRDFRDM